jgi:flagellar basal body rod protein FlgC
MAVSAINSALSGLSAAAQRISTSANNIANQNSTLSRDAEGNVSNKPYTPQDTSQVTAADGSVQTVTRPRNPSGVGVYDPSNPASDDSGVAQYPNVDLAQELVNTKIATYDFKANLNVLKEEDKRVGDLLDILS